MGDGEAEFEVLAFRGFGVSSAEKKGRGGETIGLGRDRESSEGDATHCCPEHDVMDGQGRGNRQAIGQGDETRTGRIRQAYYNYPLIVNR